GGSCAGSRHPRRARHGLRAAVAPRAAGLLCRTGLLVALGTDADGHGLRSEAPALAGALSQPTPGGLVAYTALVGLVREPLASCLPDGARIVEDFASMRNKLLGMAHLGVDATDLGWRVGLESVVAMHRRWSPTGAGAASASATIHMNFCARE